MNNISQFHKCSGCGACVQICPADAVRMSEQGLFYRPEVDERICFDCGRCVDVCPVNMPKSCQQIRSVWAGVHKEDAIVKCSSSGGAFSALAQAIQEENGVVFGAAFGKKCRNIVMTNTERVSLDALRKSKYVESLTGNSFRDVKRLLTKGKLVLYCGAPCQIAGLKRFLGQEYEKLVTCDFTCGGMPSHKLYQEYLDDLESRFGAKVKTVDFRPKTLGWETYAIRVCFENGKTVHRPAKLDPYFSAFVYKHYSVGDLCLECPFSDNHYADITLADFWRHRDFTGWEEPGQGLSLILVSSSKGEQLLEKAAERMNIRPLDIQEGTYNIRKTVCSPDHKKKREMFLQAYRMVGLKKASAEHCLPSGAKALKSRVKYLIRYLLWSVK